MEKDKVNVIEAIDLAFRKSSEFTRGERYDQMKEVYLGLREEMLDLNFSLLPESVLKRALDVKGYMGLFWKTTDSNKANRVYRIKIKVLENIEALTYGREDLMPEVAFTLNKYLKSLTDDEIIENEQNLTNLQYLTGKINEIFCDEEWDDNSI